MTIGFWSPTGNFSQGSRGPSCGAKHYSCATANRSFNKWLAVSSFYVDGKNYRYSMYIIYIHVYILLLSRSVLIETYVRLMTLVRAVYIYRYPRRRSGRNRDEHPSIGEEKCTRLHWCSECRQTGNESVVWGWVEVVAGGSSIWLWLKTVQHPDRVIR